MMNNYNGDFATSFGAQSWIHANGGLLVLLIVWSIFWKGLALWHAGRKGQPWWFMILLVINTFGILEIIYLFGVAKLKGSELFKK